MLRNRGSSNSFLRRSGAQGVAGTFSLRIVQSGLGLLINLILARVLGAAAYGVYAVVLAVTNVMTVVSLMGTNQLLVREVAKYRALKSWGKLRGIVRWTNRAVALSSAFVCTLTVIVLHIQDQWIHPSIVSALFAGSLVVPLAAFASLRQGAMQGLNRVVSGQIPEQLAQPLLMLCLVGGASMLSSETISTFDSIVFYLLSVLGSFLLGCRLLGQALPSNVLWAASRHQRHRWLHSCPSFLLVSLTSMLNDKIPVIVLGSASDTSNAGVFYILTAISNIVFYFTVAFSLQLAPKVSELYTKGVFAKLERVLIRSARANFLMTLFFALATVLCSEKLLMLFGTEYLAGIQALAILLVGHILYTLIGFPGILLTMTHHESDAAKCNTLATFVNILLCLLLIPMYGLTGAVVARASSSLVRGLSMASVGHYRLHIGFTVLGRVSSRDLTVESVLERGSTTSE